MPTTHTTFAYPQQMNTGTNLQTQAVELFRKWYHLGLSTTGDPWSFVVDGISPNNSQFQLFSGAMNHFTNIVRLQAERSRSMLYENDSSRGSRGRSTRRGENPPDRTPTSGASQTPWSSSTPHNPPPSIYPNYDGQRGQKRRRLAPAPTLTPVSSSLTTPPILEEPEPEPGSIFPPAAWAEARALSLEGLSDGSGVASHNTNDLATRLNLPVNPSEVEVNFEDWVGELDDLEQWRD